MGMSLNYWRNRMQDTLFRHGLIALVRYDLFLFSIPVLYTLAVLRPMNSDDAFAVLFT